MVHDIITSYLLVLGEDIIVSYLLIIVGCMACIAGYLDMAKD